MQKDGTSLTSFLPSIWIFAHRCQCTYIIMLGANYTLIWCSNGNAPLIKVGEYSEMIKLQFKLKDQIGRSRPKMTSRSGHTDTRHLLGLMPLWHPCWAVHPHLLCHAPLPSHLAVAWVPHAPCGLGCPPLSLAHSLWARVDIAAIDGQAKLAATATALSLHPNQARLRHL
jgi:hypothetical protein